MKIQFLLIIFLFWISSCGYQSATPISAAEANRHKIVVKEVIQTTQYTYLKVQEIENEYWIAVNKIDAKTGETYYYSGGHQMTNFESKELKRNFESILFLDAISKNEKETEQTATTAHKHNAKYEKKDIKIEPAKDCITIAEIFANSEKYNGKTIKIKAQIVKVNKEIMDRNWYHIQDGTENNGNYDLTVTSKANFNLNDILIIEGKLITKKDFGNGYTYDLIVEDAIAK